MKPAETLGMIEEAAGTKMYEAKKAASIRSMDKKVGRCARCTKGGDVKRVGRLGRLELEVRAALMERIHCKAKPGRELAISWLVLGF